MIISGEKIAITGGAGFIGTALVQSLIEENQIVIIDNFTRDSISGSGLLNHPNLQILNADVTESQTLGKALKDASIVIHLAAIAGIDTVLKDPIKTMYVNFYGTYNVLQNCIGLIGLKRVLIFSTSEVYGANAVNVDESSNAVTGSAGEARWAYAVSKLSCEHLSQAFFNLHGVPVTIIRPFNVYGPGQVGDGAINTFIKRATAGEELLIDGDGLQVRAWCYIEDFINILMKILAYPGAIGKSFNVGNSLEPLSIIELAKLVIDATNSTSEIKFMPPLSADIAIRIPKTVRVRELLGSYEFTPLRIGIEKTSSWYKNHRGSK